MGERGGMGAGITPLKISVFQNKKH
jgi:hypothetical protein